MYLLNSGYITNSYIYFVSLGSWITYQVMWDRDGQNSCRTREKQVEIYSFSYFFLKNLSRHEQLKQEEKMMEDQIKVNAEAVESLIRILSK